MRLPFVLEPAQLAMALGGAAVVMLALYLLRERYRPVLVSHLPLWRESMRRSTPLAIARRLRKLLSWLLQMLIVAVALLALMNPSWGERREPRDVVILVDVSPSMDARDAPEGLTRIDHARSWTSSYVEALESVDRVLLVAMSATPGVALSWSPPGAAARDAIGELATRPGRADPAEALRFALAALDGSDAGRVVLVGDGAHDLEGPERTEIDDVLALLDAAGHPVLHHRCGEAGENIAITRFAMRQDLRDRVRFDGMLEVARFTGDPDAGPLPVRLEARAGGHPVLARRFELTTGSEQVWLDLPSPPSRRIEAALSTDDPEMNLLSTDDAALVELPEETGLRVLAVSEGNTYLQAAMLLSPSWEVEWLRPGQEPPSPSWDVVVVDRGASLPDVEARGILWLRPEGGDAPFATDGELETPAFETFDREHPITRWINLYNVNIGSAVRIVPEKGDRILGDSGDGPLLVLREPEDGPRLMALAFDISESDLPLRAAWPLLFLNTVHHLGGESLEVASSTASPGEADIAPHWLPGTTHRGEAPRPHPRQPPPWILLAAALALLLLVEWFTWHRRWTV